MRRYLKKKSYCYSSSQYNNAVVNTNCTIYYEKYTQPCNTYLLYGWIWKSNAIIFIRLQFMHRFSPTKRPSLIIIISETN
jgi:hypothetical protein